MNSEILGNRYEIQQQLGKKAGRRTLLARDFTTDELVIIKLLSFSSDFEWDDLKLFEREAETLKSLSHPCIPCYLDYFEVNSPTYKGFALIQTYISASTLEQYLQTGRTFTEIEVKAIASSVLEILIYLHGLYPPVIHRDIKPSNILLGERSGNSVGQVYLVDFGSVQTVLATEGSTCTVVGTYGYMPQEQFGGRTVPASDLYSLGATLIYLATGTQPADLPQKDFRIQFQQLTNLSPTLTNWLKQITEPTLEKRFASATEALTALEQPQIHNTTALTIGKPAGSKIQLIKNEEFLEITIPAVGFQSSMMFLGFFAVAWNSFILIWTIGALSAPFPANIPFALFSLPFWGVGFSMIYGILYGLFGSIKLRIDHQQIFLNHQLGKWKIPRRRSASRESINKLVYTPKYFTKDSDGDKTQIPAKFVLWAGVEKFELDVNNATIKSEAELEWLAHELSNWLNIEITT
ncbi:serine/threonine protein kinase [Anabaena cylindrica FACHB-243]|nr:MULTISPECIES: serine/threonine-protein kinase [Anabaena]MBD2419134.1 serine/threonine protein kinase [Anabaena cylindrica FACHB-243]MBY5284045.1 serine/threonine protein kinase [Anabaena sp. CCAP 1446/1C]MBY5306818.1 serine/threonine protein kinase [Anabaena sp. CCAP 1446/1C]MCM2409604.1 serine/threonine protein kinase [Anabaena sp. CCAP 1446/1C]